MLLLMFGVDGGFVKEIASYYSEGRRFYKPFFVKPLCSNRHSVDWKNIKTADIRLVILEA